MLFFFGVDYTASQAGKSIDWSYVRSHVSGNPLFIFENAGGFTHADSDGAYSWVHPTDIGSYPGSDPFDTASFLPNYYQGEEPCDEDGLGRRVQGIRRTRSRLGRRAALQGQQCGKTWLDTLAPPKAEASRLAACRLPTWDDYEEGTEIETGIRTTTSRSGSLATVGADVHLAVESGAPSDCTGAIAGGLDLRDTLDHLAVYAS